MAAPVSPLSGVSSPAPPGTKQLVLVGNPNVGKSVFFNHLSGFYVDVSNYPGTTVEIARAAYKGYEVVDTPGVYGVSSFNEEERIARDLILSADVILNIADATHLERDLFLTLQLLDFGKPMVMALNFIDEAEREKISVDAARLSHLLGIEVVPTAAVTGRGLAEIEAAVDRAGIGRPDSEILEKARHLLSRVENLGEAILTLEGDAFVAERYNLEPGDERETFYRIRRRRANAIVEEVVRHGRAGAGIRRKLGDLCLHPMWGSAIALFLLYFLIYKFVGLLIAGEVVGVTEDKMMKGYYEPWLRAGGQTTAGWVYADFETLRADFLDRHGSKLPPLLSQDARTQIIAEFRARAEAAYIGEGDPRFAKSIQGIRSDLALTAPATFDSAFRAHLDRKETLAHLPFLNRLYRIFFTLDELSSSDSVLDEESARQMGATAEQTLGAPGIREQFSNASQIWAAQYLSYLKEQGLPIETVESPQTAAATEPTPAPADGKFPAFEQSASESLQAYLQETVLGGVESDLAAKGIADKTVLKKGQSSVSKIGTILIGEFGVLTMTMTYLVGLLFPLVLAFYFVLALLEDSGYLPRLAALTDGILTSVGLNGRAVIPLIVGLGCVQMGTISTRLLGSQRERTIATTLLNFVIPCSAQLGVITLMLPRIGLRYTVAYVLIIFGIFVILGTILNRFMPGQSSALLTDLPPLRWPQPKNVVKKTAIKAKAFLKEAFPWFLLGSLLVSLMQVWGLLDGWTRLLRPLTEGWLRLPSEAATAFILGMVRRDFGAAGLTALPLTAAQTLVALVVMTLFVPCIASLMIIIKERGGKEATAIWVGSWVAAIAVGGLVSRSMGWL
ncbi:MAG: ferrous iron transporter B [bacterium]